MELVTTYTISKEEDIHQMLNDHYGISGSLKKLDGEVDLNFKISTDKGNNYLLKISASNSGEQEQDFQVQLMSFLKSRNLAFEIPGIIQDVQGKYIILIHDQHGAVRFVRLQTWLEGRLVDSVNPWDSQLMSDWGGLCGTLSKELAGFDHPAAHRKFAWDPLNCLEARKFCKYFVQEEKLQIADHFWSRFEKYVLPALSGLRKSVNYNDAHEQNLLVSDGKQGHIIGLIDFGDAVYTATINELAIACAYALMRSPDPLRSSFDLIKGYHTVFPLQAKEIEVLYDLIAARLLITVSHAAYNASLNPANTYLQVSDKPAWDLLKKWYAVSPAFAHCYFRYACGWEACEKRSDFDAYLDKSKPYFHPVMSLDLRDIKQVDLSVSSSVLGHFKQVETLDNFEKWMLRYKEDEQADLLYGGYMEPRNFYSTDNYAEMGLYGPQWRSIHAGLDLWSDSREPIYAVHSGIIKYLKNNSGLRNYGPTIILEHSNENGLIFYSLYGHLTQDSLTLYSEGTKVEGGQLIAYVGNSEENGEWPPHLHFQVMLDLLDLEGDFPGVVYPHEKDIWRSLCPDPAKLIGLDLPNKYRELSLETIIEKRNSMLGKSLSLSYDKPLHMVRGQLQYLLEHTGRKYLDTVNNVAHAGHEHPAIVEAVTRQTGVLNTNTRYLHENIVGLAEQLLEKLPKEFEVIYFVNSGSEANELAVRMCENWSASKQMIVLASGYHGNTGRCVELSSYKFDGRGGSGAPPHTHVVSLPDIYRGEHKAKTNAGILYAEEVKIALNAIKSKGLKPAGFIAESIVSCGGQVVMPVGYLKLAYKMVREAGGLCIADEVQTGLGRVGAYYWAFQIHDVVPDIVTIGKPLGNGHPIAAVACTRAVADAFSNGMEYFNTFGGNPVSCAAGSAVLRVVDNENLMFEAGVKGEYWKSGLKSLQSTYPIIGDVRGSGLFLGFELVRNDTLEPATDEAKYLINRMRQMGVLTSTDGPHNNVIKIKPPLCISRGNIDLFLDRLECILREDQMRV